MKAILIISLAVVAIACNATMDEIRFHWSEIFGYWFRNSNDKGAIRWFAPALSWKNKYKVSDNKYITWIFSSPLVFITDFWHFLKFVMLNCIYGIITILADTGFHWFWMMLGCNIVWGIIYEFTSGIFGVLGDKKRLK